VGTQCLLHVYLWWWLAPVLVGVGSDILGGDAEGLQIALLCTTIGGLLGAFLFWLSSRHYPADVERVKNYVLEAES